MLGGTNLQSAASMQSDFTPDICSLSAQTDYFIELIVASSLSPELIVSFLRSPELMVSSLFSPELMVSSCVSPELIASSLAAHVSSKVCLHLTNYLR